jgi:MerR HTH family regulatory protein
MARMVRVSEVARELGISPSRLPQLADRGVVPSERSPGGHRLFDPGAVRSALASLASEELDDRRWSSPGWHRVLPLNGLQEDVAWREILVDLLQDRLSLQARSAASYAFTGMLNNAIDHSGASTATVSVWAARAEARFEVSDEGRGDQVRRRDLQRVHG